MTSADDNRRSLTVNALLGVALILLAIMYFTPIWWVSLKAPNYPPEAFPDGIRIHFHFNGVFNGCSLIESKEVQVYEALNCVHEMDTINHYVGMYPIASGGPIERVLSQFLVTFLGVMLISFAFRNKKIRAQIMALGFGAIAIWMYMAMYTDGGVMLLTEGYRDALQSSLDLDIEEIQHMSGIEAVIENYRDTLGIYFGQLGVTEDKINTMRVWTNGIVVALVAAMLILIAGAYLNKLFYWLLIIVPILLPVFFIIDYAAWLWYFGHNLNAMGAFAVKPFMPTVFGQGKVAQFSTHSYPHIGFFIMMGISAILIVVAMLRKKQIHNEGD